MCKFEVSSLVVLESFKEVIGLGIVINGTVTAQGTVRFLLIHLKNLMNVTTRGRRERGEGKVARLVFFSNWIKPKANNFTKAIHCHLGV